MGLLIDSIHFLSRLELGTISIHHESVRATTILKFQGHLKSIDCFIQYYFLKTRGLCNYWSKENRKYRFLIPLENMFARKRNRCDLGLHMILQQRGTCLESQLFLLAEIHYLSSTDSCSVAQAISWLSKPIQSSYPGGKTCTGYSGFYWWN